VKARRNKASLRASYVPEILQLAQAFNDQERRLATLSMAAAWLSLAEQHLKNCAIAETVLVYETSTPVDEQRKPPPVNEPPPPLDEPQTPPPADEPERPPPLDDPPPAKEPPPLRLSPIKPDNPGYKRSARIGARPARKFSTPPERLVIASEAKRSNPV